MSESEAEYKIKNRPPTIFRTVKNKDNPYVMIDRRPIDNPELSFKAKGILTYLLSRPDGWEVNLVDLANRSTDGISSVRAGAKELQEAGHLKHATIKDESSGLIVSHLWEVYETPHIENLTLDTPQVGVNEQENYENQNAENHNVDKPQCGKSHASIKQLSNKEIIKYSTGRANIFEIYEQNIGILTPMVADVLKAVETEYPQEWIPAAFEEAIRANARNLKYIEAILKRWKAEGFMSPKLKPIKSPRRGKSAKEIGREVVLKLYGK